jgi:hypothetical protein
VNASPSDPVNSLQPFRSALPFAASQNTPADAGLTLWRLFCVFAVLPSAVIVPAGRGRVAGREVEWPTALPLVQPSFAGTLAAANFRLRGRFGGRALALAEAGRRTRRSLGGGGSLPFAARQNTPSGAGLTLRRRLG